MKKLSLALAVAASFTTVALAKDTTLLGEGKCLKCALKQSDKCQNVVEVKKGDKVILYTLTGDVQQKFHGELCQKTKNVEVVGVLTEKDGKHMLEVSKIKEVEKK